MKITVVFAKLRGRFTFKRPRHTTFRPKAILEVNSDLTIADLKAMLAREPGFPKKNRILLRSRRFRGRSSDPPDDTSTIRDCGIKHRDILFASDLPGRYTIYICNELTRKKYPVRVSCLDTIHRLKNVIRVKTGYDPEELYIHHWRTSLSEQDDNTRLIALGIDEDDQIVVKPKKLPVLVNRMDEDAKRSFVARFRSAGDVSPTGSQIKIFIEKYANFTVCIGLSVRRTDTIDALKDVIATKTWIDARFVLLFNRSVLSDGFRTLAQYGIDDQDIIQMCWKSRTHIEISPPYWPHQNRVVVPGSFSVKVRRYDTVGFLKELIQSKTGVTIEKQNLSYRGVCMDNDTWIMLDYGILGMDIDIVFLLPSPLMALLSNSQCC